MKKVLLVCMLLLPIVTYGNNTKETGDIDTTLYDNRSLEEKNSALMFASKYGYLEIVKFLVENGVDINTKTSITDETALYYASKEGHTEIVKLLEDVGQESDYTKIHSSILIEVAY